MANRVSFFVELEFEKFGFPRLKIGHGGTLDSNARGVLAVGLGTGCSLLSHFLHTDKVMSKKEVINSLNVVKHTLQ